LGPVLDPVEQRLRRIAPGFQVQIDTGVTDDVQQRLVIQVAIRVACYRGTRKDDCQSGMARSKVVSETDQGLVVFGLFVQGPGHGLAAVLLQGLETLRILQQIEAELDSMRPIPGVLSAMIPDLSREIEVTRFQHPFDEIFEMPWVEFMLAGALFALHEHVEGEFPQAVIQGTSVAGNELVVAQLGQFEPFQLVGSHIVDNRRIIDLTWLALQLASGNPGVL